MKKSEAEMRGDALNQLEALGRCSIPNAAVLMGVHHHSLRRYVEGMEVEAFWVGTRPWIMKEEIERFQREGKRTPNFAPTSLEANYGMGEIAPDDAHSDFF